MDMKPFVWNMDEYLVHVKRYVKLFNRYDNRCITVSKTLLIKYKLVRYIVSIY